MPKITTGTRNVAAEIGRPASPRPARRAWEKFKRDVRLMPLRLANVFGNCKVAPPSSTGRTLETYLSKLSQGKMDPTDTMRALARLAESPPKTGDGGLSDVQSYGLLKNLKSHGEMFTVLDGCIESMTKENEEKPLNENEKELLTLLQTMKKNQDGVAQKLMTQIAYGKEQLAVHADADEAGRLRKAFDTAWKRASNGDDRNAADLLKTELSRAQDLRRSEKGTPEQRKFAKDLKAVRDAFGEEGIIAEAPLTNLLERSLRKSGWSVQLAKDLVKRLTTQPGVKAQWNLLGPLLRAMSDQIDGVETSRQDLLKAIKKIQEASSGSKDLEAPNLAKAKLRLDVASAIHDLAHYIENNISKDQKLDNDAFKAAVSDLLRKQDLTSDVLRLFLDHADALDLNGRSLQVRTAVSAFLSDHVVRGAV